MDTNKKAELLQLLKELKGTNSCCLELKNLISKLEENFDEETLKQLKIELEDAVTPIEKSIAFIESDMGLKIFGEKRDEVLAFAKKRQAEGEKICTCDACQVGAKVLKLLAK